MVVLELAHPTHWHPLHPLDLRFEPFPTLRECCLCSKGITDYAYSCRDCRLYLHMGCAEAPRLIERHPSHPIHPLSLSHTRTFHCDACSVSFKHDGGSFGCDECGFYLDSYCALSTLPPDRRGPPLEQITLPVHDHTLTLFTASGGHNCSLCKAGIEGEGFVCLRRRCYFRIHKRCVEDLYYADGTKVPLVFHEHGLETFSPEEVASIIGADREAITQVDHIGCRLCRLFFGRGFIKEPGILRYPPHSNHTFVLFICQPDAHKPQCGSCSSFLEMELFYRCTTCHFILHVGCGLRTLGYYEEGMRVEIKLSWHEHPMILCNVDLSSDSCSRCERKFDGPTYKCKVEDCGFALHRRCVEPISSADHPLHPEHPITFRTEGDGPPPRCDACREIIVGSNFSCEPCAFYLHVECSTLKPTRKHYLHEHELIQFNEIPSLECNRCGASTDSPLLRCVPCDFNLHEKCTDLPGVVKHDTHFHQLTLRETFVEDDSGEYYCDLCEERRDGRLGVYVCLLCKMDRPWAFHIECILPELRGVNMKKVNDSAIKRLAAKVVDIEAEVSELSEKLEESKQQLDELRETYEQLVLTKSSDATARLALSSEDDKK